MQSRVYALQVERFTFRHMMAKFNDNDELKILTHLAEIEFWKMMGWNDASINEIYKLLNEKKDMTRNTIYRNLMLLVEGGVIESKAKKNTFHITITKRGQERIKYLRQKIKMEIKALDKSMQEKKLIVGE